MQVHPFRGARQKLEWAYVHSETLKAEIAASDYADSVGFRQEFNADESVIHITLDVPELPIRWGLLAADSLQNLRCALNYVAWELAAWNLRQQGIDRDPKSATQFPINTKLGEFSDYRVKDLHAAHVALIRRLQPNGTNHMMELSEFQLRTFVPKTLAIHINRHPLAQLASFTNDDKHRLIPAVVTSAQALQFGNYEGVNCTLDGVEVFGGMSTENRPAKWATARVSPLGTGKPEVKMDDRIEPVVRFSGLTVDDLLAIGQAVEEVIYFFAPAIEDGVSLAPFGGG